MPTSNDSDTTGTWDFALSDGSPAELSVEAQPGIDGAAHVLTIFFGPKLGSGFTWDAATAANVARTLLPPDAHHSRDMSTSVGTNHIYRSVRLAATFPASDFFTDVGSHTVPPGTCDYYCRSDSFGGITRCVMRPGQHQLAAPTAPNPAPTDTPEPTRTPKPVSPTATSGNGGK
jgi:hypothetical protein